MLLKGAGGGASSDWSPLALAPALWLDATHGLYQERTGASATTPAASDGDPVGTWLDRSGNANHATAASDAARLTLKLAIQNGLPVLRADEVDDGFVSTLTRGMVSDSLSTLMVWRPKAVANKEFCGFSNLDGYSPNYHNLGVVALTATTGQVLGANNYDGSEHDSYFDSVLASQAAVVLAGLVNDGGFNRCYRDGVLQALQPATGTPAVNSAVPYRVGKLFYPSDCDFCELVVVDGIVSAAAIAAFTSYARSKWGTP